MPYLLLDGEGMVLEHQKIAEGTLLPYWVEAVAYAVALPLSQDLCA
jgi:hypothetical protein